MNIDKLGTIYEPLSPKPKRPTNFEEDLEIIELDRPTSAAKASSTTRAASAPQKPSSTRKNVLEISCCHETSTAKPKISYLDKLKTRVRNISEKTLTRKSPEKITLPSPSDLGTFTSVTVSGVLSVKPTLDDHIVLKRRNSLTKAAIENSEYVQGISKVSISKAQTCESPKTSTDDDESSITDKSTTALKTASTKKDWIQEWARNAREFSSKQQQNSTQMTRSYGFDEDNRRPAKQQFNNLADFEYSSDPNLRYKEYQNIRKQHQLNLSSGSSTHLLSPSKTVSKNAMLYGSDDNNAADVSPSSGGYFCSKPPPSPSKIPSPIQTMGRARSSSRNASICGSKQNLTDLDLDTEMHLQNTAAAISALQNLHRRNSLRNNSSIHNSPKSSLSPVHRISPKTTSPVHSLMLQSPMTDDDEIPFSPSRRRTPTSASMHKRNGSVPPDDRYYHHLMASSATSDNLILDSYRRQQQMAKPRRPSASDFEQTNEFCHDYHHHHNHHNLDMDDDEYEDDNIVIVEKGRIISGQNVPIKKPLPMLSKTTQKLTAPTSSPIKRSSSFSIKGQTAAVTAHQSGTKTAPKINNSSSSSASKVSATKNSIQKSASSTSFRKLLHYDEDDVEFYVNIDDNDEYSSNSSEDDEKNEPITNTRYNKAFLMRVEQSKKAIAGPAVKACPNTPETSRREVNLRRDRASMPRDASLNRLKQDIHSSLSNAKKHLKDVPPSKDGSGTTTTTKAGPKVLPKYMDISKYKSPQGGATFLKKDESKLSYLAQKNEVKRSPSSASVVMTRSDPSRASTRSVKSAGARPSLSKKNDPISEYFSKFLKFYLKY